MYIHVKVPGDAGGDLIAKNRNYKMHHACIILTNETRVVMSNFGKLTSLFLLTALLHITFILIELFSINVVCMHSLTKTKSQSKQK